jgi:hypothetical protein
MTGGVGRRSRSGPNAPDGQKVVLTLSPTGPSPLWDGDQQPLLVVVDEVTHRACRNLGWQVPGKFLAGREADDVGGREPGRGNRTKETKQWKAIGSSGAGCSCG